MHILMTANAAWNLAHFRRPVIKALLADGHRITVLAPTDQAAAELERLGCRFEPLAMNVKGLNPLDDLRLMLALRRAYERLRPDVVLSYTIKNNIFGALAARTTGTPFLPNVTGLGTAFLSGGPLQAVAEGLYRLAFAKLRTVFFQNGDDRDLFVSRKLVRAEQVRLLPGSGIDLAHFAATPLPSTDAQPTFLMIARLLRDKGVHEFVEAARIVRQSHQQARFLMLGAAGSDNRSAISAETVKQWVAEGVVEHLGTTTDVRPFIAGAHCVVLPSYREGAPRTLIEAAAMARPLIATDVPGCREVVDANVSGLLCAPRDAQSLAEAMLRFLDLSPEQQQQMGHNGRLKMEAEFDEALVVSAYREAIAAVVDKPAV